MFVPRAGLKVAPPSALRTPLASFQPRGKVLFMSPRSHKLILNVEALLCFNITYEDTLGDCEFVMN